MKFYETINADKLAYILTHRAEYGEIQTNNKNLYNMWVLSEKYLMKYNDDKIETEFTYAKGKTEGRLYAKSGLSLQSIQRRLRHTISRDYYYDIDIINCCPTILLQLCKNNKINCPILDLYVKKREAKINELIKINKGYARDFIKQVFISIIFSGTKNYNLVLHKSEFLTNFKVEMEQINKTLCSEVFKDEFKKYRVPKNDKQYENKLGSFMNFILCIEEGKILNCMMNYFNIKDGSNAVPCFDGLMLPNDREYDIVACEKTIKDKLGYDIKLKLKEMDEHFNLPDDIPAFDPLTFKWTILDKRTAQLLNEGLNDASVSYYIRDVYGDDYKLCDDYIYSWNGERWSKDPNNNSLYILINEKVYPKLLDSIDKYFNSDSLNDTEAEQKNNLLKQISKLRQSRTKDGIIKEVRVLIEDKDIKFDTNPDLIAFKNGVYDLLNNIFRKGEKTDYITLFIPYDWRESTEEEKERLHNFINRVMPVQVERDFFLKGLSSSICGRVLENLLILSGNGRNGKDTLISYLLMETLGKSFMDYSNNTLITGKNSTGVNQEKANLDRKRCIVFNEPDGDTPLRCNTIKEITGGKNLNARGLYSKICECLLNSTTLLLCNKIPLLDKPDEAMSLRLFVIPFRSMFRTKEFIDTLPVGTEHVYEVNSYYKEDSFLKDNRLAFFNLLLEYYQLFKKDGYILKNPPQSILELSKAYMTDSDNFYNWFNDKYEKTDNYNDVVKMKDLYAMFRCSDLYMNMNRNEKRAMNKKRLSDDIQNNQNLKLFYRNRIKINGTEYNQCLIGFKLIEDDQYTEDDE